MRPIDACRFHLLGWMLVERRLCYRYRDRAHEFRAVRIVPLVVAKKMQSNAFL